MSEQSNEEDLRRLLKDIRKDHQKRQKEFTRRINHVTAKAGALKIAMSFAVLGLCLFFLTKGFQGAAEVIEKEYFRYTLIAKILNGIGFLLAVLAIGMVLFLWKNSRNQFWYGIVEIVASCSYSYHYLNRQGSLDTIYWLTAFYFAARGLQNANDGMHKPFKYKFKIIRRIVHPYIQNQNSKKAEIYLG